jgi:adenylyltransferase/sulfurtransferase
MPVQRLTEDQIRRYHRHIIMPQVGPIGQRKLLNARVLLLGAGGLGSPAALYLAAAGVGTIGIVDFDTVDVSNLQRQILHTTANIGKLKVDSAAEMLNAINPDVNVVKFPVALRSDNVFDVIKDFDIIVDGTDNFQTRYLINDASVMTRKPVVHGSIFQFDGQVTVFKPFEGPCYRCLFPSPPPPGSVPNCAEAGVLGVLPGIVGCIEAVEAMKLILGEGEPLIGRLLIFDALAMEFSVVKIRRDPACPVCGEHPTIHELIDYEEFCGVPSRDGVLTH